MLVDTSVWSLLLHRKRPQVHPAVTLLEGAVLKEQMIFIAGIIVQEVLQGIRSDLHRQKVLKYLKDFDFLEADLTVHEEAALIFSACRAKGISAHTVDCLIAALAIHHHVELLTTDKDFILMSKFLDLRLITF